MHQRRIMRHALGIGVAGLVCLQPAAFAQTAPTMYVDRTPHYTLSLAIGPVETMVSQMDAMQGQTGEVGVTGGSMSHDPSMVSDHADQGMAANHHLEVHISQADSGSVVMDVTPTIRITDKSNGESRDLPQVMGMYGASVGMSDFNYGQNVFLPDGAYQVKVLVGSDTAEFRDVMVVANAMMSDHAMGSDTSMSHDAGMSHP